MLRFLVAPVDVKPTAAPTAPDHVQHFRGEIGQIHLDRTKRLDALRQRDRCVGIGLRVGNVGERIPAPLLLGHVEIFKQFAVEEIFHPRHSGNLGQIETSRENRRIKE